MPAQLDLLSYHPSPSPAATQPITADVREVHRFLHSALDALDIALEALRSAQDLAIASLEKPESRISYAIQDIWEAIYQEKELY